MFAWRRKAAAFTSSIVSCTCEGNRFNVGTIVFATVNAPICAGRANADFQIAISVPTIASHMTASPSPELPANDKEMAIAKSDRVNIQG